MTDKQTNKGILQGRSVRRLTRSGEPLDPSITQAQVSMLVEEFYQRIRSHPRLSILFAGGMTQEWPEHLDRMKAFWRSMLMQTREYDGRPVPAHMKMKDLRPEDFDQWLMLFRETASEVCPASAAALYISRAETIARTLQMALFLNGQIVPAEAFHHGSLRPEWRGKLPQEPS